MLLQPNTQGYKILLYYKSRCKITYYMNDQLYVIEVLLVLILVVLIALLCTSIFFRPDDAWR